jgi:hypothetical protein
VNILIAVFFSVPDLNKTIRNEQQATISTGTTTGAAGLYWPKTQ